MQIDRSNTTASVWFGVSSSGKWPSTVAFKQAVEISSMMGHALPAEIEIGNAEKTEESRPEDRLMRFTNIDEAAAWHEKGRELEKSLSANGVS